MAVVNTKAIVLSSLKYGDTSLIVKCYTEQEGVKSYLIRGVLKPKKKGIKAAYFQPLTQLKIVAKHNQKNTLNAIKEVQVINPYKTIHSNIVKQSVVFFLSEVLSNSIQEEEQNKTLYSYLETAFTWLDVHDKIANFHLLFLLNLTGFLGFYPDMSEQDKKGFNLLEGVFSDNVHHELKPQRGKSAVLRLIKYMVEHPAWQQRSVSGRSRRTPTCRSCSSSKQDQH